MAAGLSTSQEMNQASASLERRRVVVCVFLWVCVFDFFVNIDNK